ncbi:hypothetical protein FisN_6Hh297 [Fistulifera solaris]|uniref:DUF1279 domain-containing protein n=1 Tax=Fistulifera solaris TaxID=1519565 RepID=A0A1Z5K700_FISSO|nr:hypothetical protein FisN_6Hh297 [Fistulifera solaris]|eukprot:GAX22050.1 hypothetical protein FisN_6Hh297 [Fistulifera solaris]
MMMTNRAALFSFVASMLLASSSAFAPRPLMVTRTRLALADPSQTMESSNNNSQSAPSVTSSLGGEYMQRTAIETPPPAEDKNPANMMQQIKDAGKAGIISYALWELGFWFISIPFCLFAYQQATGHWPDLSNPEDTAKLGAEAFAFVNFARFAVPLRIGLALSTTPWIQKNVVDKFGKEEKTGA